MPLRAPGAEPSPVGASDDASLDLDRFAEHPRVATYLRYFQGPGRATMTRLLDRGAAYLPMIRDRLAAADLPSDLGYLALIESGFRNTAVSRKGAVGMWQFMPSTAREYGLRVDSRVDERRDPFKATDAAVRHLQDLKNRFGSIYLAAAAYNAGAERVSQGLDKLRRSDGLEPRDAEPDSLDLDADFFRLSDASLLAPETANYVPQLIAAALIAKDPERFDFESPDAPDAPLDSLRLRGLAFRPAAIPASAFHAPVVRRSALSTTKRPPSVDRPPSVAQSHPHSSTTRAPSMGIRVASPSAKSARPSLVRVQRGDTVESLARHFGVSARQMRHVNALPKDYRLRPGQILRLPVS